MFFIVLAAWIIFNGAVTLEIMLFGIVLSAAVCAFMSILTEYSIKAELKQYKKLPFILLYIPVLVFEIVKANIITAAFIIKGNKKIKPVIVCFDSPLKTEYASSILANSITLTPGTIAVGPDHNEYSRCNQQHTGNGCSASVCKLRRKLSAHHAGGDRYCFKCIKTY